MKFNLLRSQRRMRNNIQPVSEINAKWLKLRNNLKELTIINYKQEKRVQYLETRATHLVMFYIAFQYVIFQSISKPSAIQCSSWWKPFSLSLLVAFIFALNFTIILIEYVHTQYYHEQNVMDKQENHNRMVLLESQQVDLDTYDVEIHIDMPCDMQYLPRSTPRREKKQQKPDMFAVYQRYAHICVTVSALVAFTVLVLHACRSSVCGGD